ncbi:MAG: RNA methyltransferase, partial [Anaerolineales bacterium]|nr:RNA methyltransferase [Anaerolineales bacterium]
EGLTDPADRPVITALLHNIRSLWNVGSMFRTADGAGIDHIYLTGYTATPEHPKMTKTALGAEQAVAWTSWRDGVELARGLREAGCRLWALELGEGAVPLFDVGGVPAGGPIVLVFGHEVDGVDPEIHALCERTLYIPMAGMKESLNVAVAFGIATYHICHLPLIP